MEVDEVDGTGAAEVAAARDRAVAPVLAPLPELTPAGTRLLDAASELFYARGVRAVGVDLIAEAAGTTKKTLYDRFGSKDALVALYLLRRAHRWRRHLLEHVEAAGPAPADRVLAVFEALEDWMGGQERGCAFVNAYAEVGGTDHPAVPLVRAEKAWMRRCFADLAGDERLGAQLHLLYEGAVVTATAGGDRDAPRAARRAARALLAAAGR